MRYAYTAAAIRAAEAEILAATGEAWTVLTPGVAADGALAERL